MLGKAINTKHKIVLISLISTLNLIVYIIPFGDAVSVFTAEESSRIEFKQPPQYNRCESFTKLNISTPQLNKATWMGYSDDTNFNSHRKKRYALQGSRWKVQNITYRITKYPSIVEVLGRDRIDAEIEDAFEVWQNVVDLTFTRKTEGKCHIEIRFESGEHGDDQPFDGEGGSLAHSFYPAYGGDIHFDDDEKWTIKAYRGYNLFQVASHHIGHALGLGFSDVRDSVMSPNYRGYNPKFKLHSDDILAIQAIYGKKRVVHPLQISSTVNIVNKSKPSPKLSPEKRKLHEKFCKDPKIDAITTMSNGNTYAFNGNRVHRFSPDGVYVGSRRISAAFPGLPNELDSAFTLNNRTYFFKGSQYWRFTNGRGDDGYPKPISEGFSGIPPNIDAAFVWEGNGKIYFFKRHLYWRFDPARTPPISHDYPKSISSWSGILENIDAALTGKGYTYFFKGDQYWKFNDRTFSIETSDPPFPRPLGKWWFGCPEIEKGKSSIK